MAEALMHKIIRSRLVEGAMVLGQEIALRIDQTLIQDATETMVWQEFGSFGIPRVRTRVCVTYVDHNTLQTGNENADDHLYLQSMAAQYGAVFSRPGNGISHFAPLERFDVLGETMLGADSHTCTAGAMAMLAIRAGGAFGPFTKWNARVETGAVIPEVVRKAFKVAQEEKPGACHIELPEDVAEEPAEGEPLTGGTGINQ